MKKILLSLCAAMFVFSSLAMAMEMKDIKLGLSMKQQNAPYFVALIEQAKKRAAELGVSLLVIDAQGNIDKQISDIDDLIASGVHAIIIDAIDPVAIVPATHAAQRAKIPVIAVDTFIDPEGYFETLILSNNFENGRKVCAYAAQFYKDTAARAAVISGSKGNIPGRDRRTGVFTGFIEEQLRTKGNSELVILAQGWGDWGQDEGLKAMEDILVAYPDINMLITENDSMALGALKAIQEAGKVKQIRIFAACDGQKEGIELIKNNNEGNYMATGINNPAVMGGMGVDAAIEVVQNGKTKLPKIYYTEPIAITIENAAKYYNPEAIF